MRGQSRTLKSTEPDGPSPLDPAVQAAISAAVRSAVAEAVAGLQPKPPARMLSTEEVMDRLGCRRSTVLRLIRSGKLRPTKLGAHNRFRADDVETLLASDRIVTNGRAA